MAKAPSQRVFELVKSLSPKERTYTRDWLGKVKPVALVKLFDSYASLEAFNERIIKGKFPDFSTLKDELWLKLLEALRAYEKENRSPAVELNRLLDYVHVLSKKNLYHLATKELDEADKICDAHNYIFIKGLINYYRSLSGNYIEETKFNTFWGDVLKRQQENLDELLTWHRTRLYYIKVCEAEKGRNFATSGHEVFPTEDFTANPLFETEDINSFSIDAAIAVAQARRTIYLKTGNVSAAYKVDEPIKARLAAGKEFVAPEWEWAWLINRCNTHDMAQYNSLPPYERNLAAERLVMYENDAKRLHKLLKDYFAGDEIRKNFMLRIDMELTSYQYTKRGKQQADYQRLRTAMNKVMEHLQTRYNLLGDVKIEKNGEDGKDNKAERPAAKFENPVVAFTLGNLFIVAVLTRRWQLAASCCNDILSYIKPTTSSKDVHRFTRLMWPIVVYETGDYSYAGAAARNLATYTNNHYDEKDEQGRKITESYALERCIANNINYIAGLKIRSEIQTAFAVFLKELQQLLLNNDMALAAFSELFSFIEWASVRAGEVHE